MQSILIYPLTDICSTKAQQPGHYGYLMQAAEEGKVKGYRIAWKHCTADTQGALMIALAEAAGRITDDAPGVVIVSDNKPILDGVLHLHRWEQDGWRRSRGRPIRRAEEWKRVSKALEKKRIAAQRKDHRTMESIMRRVREKET